MSVDDMQTIVDIVDEWLASDAVSIENENGEAIPGAILHTNLNQLLKTLRNNDRQMVLHSEVG